MSSFRRCRTDVHAGRSASVMGPSGCGKSALLMCLMGLICPELGTLGGSGEGIVTQQWLEMLSMTGALVIVVVAGIGSVAQFVRTGRELGPVSVLTGNGRVYYAVSLWSLLVPAVFAVCAAVAVTWYVTTPLMAASGSRLSALSAVGAAGLLCASVIAWCGARTASAAGAVWRPHND
ncbi:ATP-binding protein [Streptomyces chartreusis]|uniref:ATP-binding protein n=1 Tax=Streptomyces chartreusis TaxID=1969 RepID=UPI00364FC8FF